MAVTTIAVSFLVIILSVSVSSGFRREIRGALGDITGDIALTDPASDPLSANRPVHRDQSYLNRIREVEGVMETVPVAYKPGIVKGDGILCGALFKGREGRGLHNLEASIPQNLADRIGLSEGDRMLCYFISEKVKARSFTVREIHPSILDTDDKIVIEVPLADIQRLNEWTDDEISAFEIRLDEKFRGRPAMKEKASEIGAISLMCHEDGDDILLAEAVADKYPQMFDWLDLIDANVLAILVLMIAVAGFNMISGLLIFLFRNVGTIGTLKTLGMSNRGIAGVFFRVAARTVLLGMLAGNAAALALCLLQDKTHVLHLDPSNYFVSFVPVAPDWAWILSADAIAFAAILLLLLLPCIFISGVDPARTVRTNG